MKKFISKHRWEFILLLLILAVGSFLRLYRISEFLTFLGDEGRDVRIVRDLITQGNLVFIGPQTSIGNMYLGPLYYYLIAPSLFVSRLNPVGPAIMVALISILTTFLVWLVGRRWFSPSAGIVSSFLYALSPVIIQYARTSWNPNPMPFFALVCMYSLYEVWQKKSFRWLPVIGISLSFAIQMHYLGLLLAPTLVIFWLLTRKDIKKDSLKLKSFRNQTILAIIAFAFLMSPLLLFDIKHHWMNSQAFLNLFFGKSGAFTSSLLQKLTNLIVYISRDLFFGFNDFNYNPLFVLSMIPFAWIIFVKKNNPAIKLCAVWILVVIFGMSFYNAEVYIHYLGVIYPAIYLVLGCLFAYLFSGKTLLKLTGFVLLVIIALSFLLKCPTFGVPGRQLQRTERAVDEIITASNGKPFNFGLIAKRNYDESYRYFFENKKAQLVRGEDHVTDQLFVICEDGGECKPEGHPQYQIAIFGQAKVEKEWTIDHLKLYKLAHPQYAATK